MAVLKIFPEKDTTLYSLFPNMNTGLDEIVEATLTTFAYSDPNPQTSRFLIKFADEDITAAFDPMPDNIYQRRKLECYITMLGFYSHRIKCYYFS